MSDDQSNIQRPTKRLNRFYKLANRQRNIAARAAANGKSEGWKGITNPPAPNKPVYS